VSPNAPRTDAGIYWGYTVRLANTFGAVFTESPYKVGWIIIWHGQMFWSYLTPLCSWIHNLILLAVLKRLSHLILQYKDFRIPGPTACLKMLYIYIYISRPWQPWMCSHPIHAQTSQELIRWILVVSETVVASYIIAYKFWIRVELISDILLLISQSC